MCEAALDTHWLASYFAAMEAHFTKERQAQLDELAAKAGRRTGELVQEAVDRTFGYNQWFKEQVQVGLEWIERGEFIEEEEMDARVVRLLRS